MARSSRDGRRLPRTAAASGYAFRASRNASSTQRFTAAAAA
jgi:hypothetical protein